MKMPKLTMMEIAIQDAIWQQIERELDAEFPSVEECARMYKPSAAFDGRMQKLIGRQKKPYFRFTNTHARRVASILIAIALSLTITVTGVKALREPVWDFFVSIYEKFTRITGNRPDGAEPTNTALPIIVIQYEATYLPEGYVLDDYSASLSLVSYFYSFGEKLILIDQYPKSTILTVDTEEAEAVPIDIGRFMGLSTSKDGWHILVWYTDEYGFLVQGSCAFEELVKVAERLKEK